MTGRVLVTGASGYIGRSLSQRLAADGWNVRAAARHYHPDLDVPGIEYVPLGDLEQQFDWQPLLQGVSHVVHLAGIAHSDLPDRGDRYRLVNAEATRALSLAAREAGIRRLVLISSVRAQSGPAAARTLSEADPPAPTDDYGRSKLLAEQYVADAVAGSTTEWVILRPTVVYGKGAPGNLRILRRLAQSGLPLGLSGLQGRRSVVSLASVVSAIGHALVAEQCRNHTYLVADNEPVTIPEIVTILRRAMGLNPRLFALPEKPLRALFSLTGRGAAWDRIAGDLVVDTTALRQSGWSPVQSSRMGLEAWIRSETTTAAKLR